MCVISVSRSNATWAACLSRRSTDRNSMSRSLGRYSRWRLLLLIPTVESAAIVLQYKFGCRRCWLGRRFGSVGHSIFSGRLASYFPEPALA
jgi:hypothetical protein